MAQIKDPVVDWWISHPDYWFNSTPETDQKVLSALGQYLIGPYHYQILSKLGRIIVHDQIARHFARYTKLNGLILEEYIKSHLEKALRLTRELLSNPDKDYSPIEECFLLMPLRHSPNEKDRSEAIELVKKLMLKRKSSDYERFLKAALVRIRNPEKIEFEDHYLPIDLLCSSCQRNPLIIDPKEIPIDLRKSFEKIPKNSEEEFDLVISVSGGSDSMLLLWTAHQLGYRVIALGIDYGNRVEHSDELHLVEWMTSQFKIPYYVRSIKEIKRVHGTDQDDQTDPLFTMRTFYEEVTRLIRFSAYKFFGLPVLLGHNWDDCFENWVTNTISGRSPENLLGMSFLGVDSGVTLYRPFLGIKKVRIVELCNQFGIPFLVDSTPKWSRRGRIRDNIRPALDQFDPLLTERILQNAVEKSQMVQDYHELVQNYMIGRNDDGYSFKIPRIRSEIFWRLMIARISNLLGTGVVKINAVRNLIKILDQEKNNLKKITLNPKLMAILPDKYQKNEIKILET